MQVSKSRKVPLLLDVHEMEHLFSFLGQFELFNGSQPVTENQAQISKEDFLEKYARYVEGIKQGALIDEAAVRSYFSCILTCSSSLVAAIPLANGKYLIKAVKPVIQLKRHHFIFSDYFHSGVMGEGSVTWGIEFSYPQLYLDPQTQAISKVEKNQEFPNTELFWRLTKWVRDYTRPTPFQFEGKQMNQPMRLGKACFEWINHHPTLQTKRLYVGYQKNS